MARIPMFLMAAAVALSAAGHDAAFAAQSGRATLTQSQSGQRGGKKEVDTTPMQRCLDAWDRATQMTKLEWRETCKRTVKEYPDLYNKAR